MKISFCLLSVSFLAHFGRGFNPIRPRSCSWDTGKLFESLPRQYEEDKQEQGLLRSSIAVSLAAMCAFFSPVTPLSTNLMTPTQPEITHVFQNSQSISIPQSASATEVASATPPTTKSIASHNMPRYAKIIDMPGVIDPASVQTLQKRISRIESKVGTEIQIVLADQVEIGYTPKRMATSLFNSWKIGPADKNNGVLILAILDERRIEIEVGKGLNSFMDQSWCQKMLQATAVPRFRQERYGPGLVEAITDISKRLVEIDADDVTPREQKWDKQLANLPVFLIAGATFGYFAINYREIYESCLQCQADNSCWVPVDKRQGWEVTKEASYGEKGYKVRPYKCCECGYQQDAVKSFSYGSSSDRSYGSSSSWDGGGGDSGGSSDGGGGGSDW